MKNNSIKLFSLMLALLLALCACAPAAAPAEPDPTEAVAAEPDPAPAPTAEPAPAPAPAPAEPEAEPEPEAPAVSGTFTTIGQGNNAIISVETVITDNVITAVTVLEHSETPAISDAALERIPAAIVAENSLAVDTVTGSTATTKGIIAAVAAALGEAGLNVNDYYVAKEVTKTNEVVETDILVIGAGAAGLAAGVRSAQNGKDVLVIEKNSTVVGNAIALSGGQFAGAGSKLQQELGVIGDNPQQMFDELKLGGIDNIDFLLKMFADNCGDTVDWLYYDLGLPVAQNVTAYVEYKYARAFAMEGGAPQIPTKLSEKYLELGGELMLDTRAESLIVEDGKVVGAKATGRTADYEIRANKVILATGGYGANANLLPESVANVLYYGPATSTGDGLLMAMDIGADTVYLDHVKVYPQGIEVAPGKGTVATGGAMQATQKEGAIYINVEGERVINENADFVAIREATKLQTGTIVYLMMDKPAFDLFADTIVNKNKKLSQDQVDSYLAANGGNPMFAHADTIEEVAAIAGVNADTLAATVEAWNAACEAGVDEEFGNPMLNKIDEGPFYIVEQKLRFATSLGGVVVDENLQVIHTSGAPIENLYAAGEIIGGVQGQDSLPATNISWAMTSGRLVADIVAK